MSEHKVGGPGTVFFGATEMVHDKTGEKGYKPMIGIVDAAGTTVEFLAEGIIFPEDDKDKMHDFVTTVYNILTDHQNRTSAQHYPEGKAMRDTGSGYEEVKPKPDLQICREDDKH